jgi:hypothetical protein
MAPFWETAKGSKFDSTLTIASTSRGSTSCAPAMFRMSSFTPGSGSQGETCGRSGPAPGETAGLGEAGSAAEAAVSGADACSSIRTTLFGGIPTSPPPASEKTSRFPTILNWVASRWPPEARVTRWLARAGTHPAQTPRIRVNPPAKRARRRVVVALMKGTKPLKFTVIPPPGQREFTAAGSSSPGPCGPGAAGQAGREGRSWGWRYGTAPGEGRTSSRMSKESSP